MQTLGYIFLIQESISWAVPTDFSKLDMLEALEFMRCKKNRNKECNESILNFSELLQIILLELNQNLIPGEVAEEVFASIHPEIEEFIMVGLNLILGTLLRDLFK